ncbi:P27 family phage terminase small subunit [Photobacterium swingsii]|uniref:P27 family phage terminase small subunit n=1 Tax=Photobacterium swingsii TaxID=680026 RepID=UPI003D09A71B
MSRLNVPLSDTQLLKFESIKTILEAEREITPTDLDCIAMLVLNIAIMEEALKDIAVNGVTIVSHTAHGIVSKTNPANEVFNRTNSMIKGYMTELLMSPKSKASLLTKKDPVPVETEEDPLIALLKKRG